MHRFLFIPLVLAACDDVPAINGQFGEEHGEVCAEVSRDTVPSDAPVLLAGFDGSVEIVPADAVASAVGTHEATLYWGDMPELEDPEPGEPGPSTLLTSTLQVDGAIFERVVTEAEEGLDVACPTYLSTSGTVTFVTDDGQLDESGGVEIRVFENGVNLGLDVTEPGEMLDPLEWVARPDEVHSEWFRISASFGSDFGGRVDSVIASGDLDEDSETIGGW